MTVEANDTAEQYPISGVGPYAFSFRIFADTDLTLVALSSDVPPEVVPLTYLTHYTVTGANDLDGGSVTLTSQAASDYSAYTLDIRSNTPNTQPTSIRNQGRFLPEVHEDAFDHLERQIQDLSRRLDLAVRFPDNMTAGGEMTPIQSWLSKYLTISAQGTLEPAELTSSGAITQSIIAELLHPLTDLELAASATILDQTYAPGDPRRSTFYENVGMRDLGITPIYVDSDTFKVAGDVTALFPVRTRLATVGLTARNWGQILSAAFAAGETTVEMRMEIGNIPADLAAIWVYDLPQLSHMNTFMVNFNGSQVMQIVNQNDGASAATQLFIGDFGASGIGIIATKATTVGTYPGGVYYSLAPGNPISAITTGLDIPICVVTHDRVRAVFAGDGLPTQFTTSIIVQQTTENPNGSSTSSITVDGTAAAAMSWKVAGVEFGFMLVDAARAIIGTGTPDAPDNPVPLHFYTDSTKRLGIPVDGIEDFADDAAAASGGLTLWDVYRTGSTLKARVA
jgi:hypothetical protein